MTQRVVLLVNSLGRGGAEKQAALLAEGLLARGADLRILCVLDRLDYASNAVSERTVVLGKKSKWAFMSLARAVGLHLRRDDTVLCFNYYPNVLAWASGARCPRIVRYGNQPRLDGVVGPVRIVASAAQRSALASVGCTKGVARAAVDHLGSPRMMCSWIPNAVRVGGVSGRPYGPSYFVAAGRLQHEKNFGMLIDAYSRIAAEIDQHLVIAGDGPMLGELQALAERRGLGKRVVFVGYRPDLGAWLANADLTLVSSKWEGFGSVIAESLALGTPVVSTDVEFGPSEILSRVEGGVLVPPGDVNAFARVVMHLSRNPLERSRLSTVARDRASAAFSVDLMVESYAAIIRAVNETW